MHNAVRTHPIGRVQWHTEKERMFNDFNSLFRYTFHGKSIELNDVLINTKRSSLCSSSFSLHLQYENLN